ncbi:DUF885 domain-containing protein [Garicola koreensis]|uniref:Uncharacterized protein (DUF885 family) n=1 Tax=Garicola koreensis TaxID=1262554 RepID=A0A7W5XJP1_9MICC|nr:DUF885 domain-containing protein [Garicola koreensis]MBB3666557.1 uncharacterized protein (DUF885 family) [Garicola koreensis]
MTPPRTPTAVDALAESFFEDLLALAPEEATMLGRTGVQTQYGDYSPAGREAFAQLYRSVLAQLDELDPADGIDEVTIHAMRERLGVALAEHETGRTELNNIASAAHSIRMVLELMPQSTDEDFTHISGRLRNVPTALDQYWQSLLHSQQAGHVAAARQVQAVSEQAESWAAHDGALSSLTAAAAAAGVSDQVESDVRAAVAVAAEAYRRFALRLREELLPHAPQHDAVGPELYQLYSRSFTGATLDLEETYAWGLEELERIVAAQQQVAEQIRPGATVEEAKEILNSDPARVIHGTEALRDWMQQLSDAAIADLRDTHFDVPAPMDQLDCRIAPTQDGGVYYTPPSDDFSRPGSMWWSVPPENTEFTTWAETTTVYHEGVPGHHLQIGTATLVKDRLNSWRRHAGSTSGFSEGWALYAEQLMAELGYLQDPGDRMGMLDMQRMRAARVVFDIGVHCGFTAPPQWGGEVWTPQTGYRFLREHLPVTEAELDFEFVRYLGWPGQAPSYKVGQRVFEQIRAEREAQQGSDFDLRAFHTELLQLGGLGLDTLRFAMRRS